jgi:LysR family hydrogen peroxide-inducible transcriptional activator
MDLLRPTIRQIHYFVAVAEASSFRGAAAQLQVSQPTLSHQILALEEALGLRLFERSRGGTRLTPLARDLLSSSRRVLEEFQELCRQAESVTRGPGGTYRLGVTPTLGPYLLPHVLPGIHRRYAALKFFVREDAPRDLEVGLGAGEYDLILTPLPIDQTGLTVDPLFLEPLMLVIPAEHRLAKKKRIGRADLEGESVLTIEEHHHLHKQIQQLCTRLKARILRDYEGTSLDTLRQMVVMGMGIAFLPSLYVRSEIHRPRELRVATVHGEEIYRTHALVWRSSSPSRQLFREIAREIRTSVTRNLSKNVKPIPRRRRDKSTTT